MASLIHRKVRHVRLPLYRHVPRNCSPLSCGSRGKPLRAATLAHTMSLFACCGKAMLKVAGDYCASPSHIHQGTPRYITVVHAVLGPIATSLRASAPPTGSFGGIARKGGDLSTMPKSQVGTMPCHEGTSWGGLAQVHSGCNSASVDKRLSKSQSDI